MPFSGHRLPVFLLALAACGPTTPGENLPEEILVGAVDTVLTPYGAVPRAAAMGSGRWVVVAADWDAAVIVDFGAGTTTPLGAGQVGAYQRPVDVFTAGDSLYLADWGLRRLTIWNREGDLVGALAMPEAIRGVFPKARDGLGQFYFEMPRSAGPDGRGLLDSAAVLRSTPGMERFDTVAWLAPPDVLEVTRENRPRFERAIFGGQDRWGVLPDGSLWVARVGGSEVHWIAPGGAVVRGPGLPDPVYEVTDVDRQAFLAQFPPDLQSTAEALPFALVKPPFEGAFTGPEGLLWLEKSRAGVDSVRRVHLVDQEGELVRKLALATRGQVIAVGESVLLVAEQWREGVRLLQVPVPPRAPASGGN